MKLAVLYAGQGSQHPGMGAEFYEAFPRFREIYDAAPVDFDLKTTCLSDPEGLLDRTEYTQPCMVAFAAGVTALLREAGVVPAYAAGLSLGEYSALHCAGVFDAGTAVSLVAFRGRAMAEASRGIESAMVAVLGLDGESAAQCCREASSFGVAEVCNLNCPGQIVIGGTLRAVTEAAGRCRARGAKRCLPLKVSGPFHTSLLAPAGLALEKKLAEVSLGEMAFPVLFNRLGDVMGPGDTVQQLLVEQVSHPVQMEDTIRRLAEYGVDTVVEVGPGKVLTGFVRKTCPELNCCPVETPAQLEAFLKMWKGEER
ncbi:ACP S-malonyltransferase [Candidatus Pseudoscillospira sp. SGI.172]|uniref:ACP S-malonyltransferase n=1 Tax=Candidatus Pseudoscillospira sp. SGI.172 TaxID=3420582 RepID=UPI003D066084